MAMLLTLLTALTLSTAPVAEITAVEMAPEEQPRADHPYVGLQFDAAFPDGIGAGLVFMPTSFLRLHVSAVSNGVGLGGRIGVSVHAFPTWPVRPLLAVDGAYVFGGTAQWALQLIPNLALQSALSNVNVGLVDVHAGLELGSKHVALVLRGGVSWLDVDLGGHSLDLGNGVSVNATGTRLRGFIPSARLGLLFCF